MVSNVPQRSMSSSRRDQQNCLSAIGGVSRCNHDVTTRPAHPLFVCLFVCLFWIRLSLVVDEAQSALTMMTATMTVESRLLLRPVLLLLSVLLAVSPVDSFSLLSPQSQTVPQQCKVLILPGFGNNSEDYTMPNSIVSSLLLKGWSADQIAVLPIERSDWLKVFLRGALDLDFWRSDAPPTNPAFRWYLELVAKEVSELSEEQDMILLGHSAGGWLGRCVLPGSVVYCRRQRKRIVKVLFPTASTHENGYFTSFPVCSMMMCIVPFFSLSTCPCSLICVHRDITSLRSLSLSFLLGPRLALDVKMRMHHRSTEARFEAS